MPRRAVTLEDIAASAGVSSPSVSRVLNGKQGVSENLRAKVLRAADELGYQRAPSLLALVIPDPDNPYFLRLRAALQEAVEAGGRR